MSAESTLVFYGLRFEADETELESLEERTHPKQQAARAAKLNHFWGNFGQPGEQYFLFVGRQFGLIGAEGSAEMAFGDSEFDRARSETRERLKLAGFKEEPMLYVQWMPDV